jgi:hypothetical protein
MDTLIKTLLLGREEKTKSITELKEALEGINSQLRVRLFSLTPDDLKELVEEEMIVRTLVEHNKISSFIRLGDYGFKTKKAIKLTIERLLSAWDGIVTLDGRIDTQEPHRIHFSFVLVSTK